MGDKYEVNVVEMGDDTTKWQAAFYDAADAGADIVVGTGFQNKENFETIPTEYPDTSLSCSTRNWILKVMIYLIQWAFCLTLTSLASWRAQWLLTILQERMQQMQIRLLDLSAALRALQ